MSLGKSDKPDFRWAAILTGLWLGVGFLCVFAQPPGKGISTLDLNELGDLLAGFFSPIAFLWLVVGYKQQQYEIVLNTAQLRLQAEELKNLVEVEQDNLSIKREQEKDKNRERIIQLGPHLRDVVVIVSYSESSVRFIIQGKYQGPTLSYNIILRSRLNVSKPMDPEYDFFANGSTKFKHGNDFSITLKAGVVGLESAYVQGFYLEFSYVGNQFGNHRLYADFKAFSEEGEDELINIDEFSCKGVELHWCD